MDIIIAKPETSEAPKYFSKYIQLVPAGDIRQTLESQSTGMCALMDRVSDAQSLYRYAPGKWSIRELAGHVNDTERVFVFRAFWFARGFTSPLPSFDQDTAASHASADARPWRQHIAEFRAVRAATLAFLHHLPPAEWTRHGTVDGHVFTVRALAYIVAGHVLHHTAILKERYLET